jgi:beta-ribofuranosylaminobenzene 5'-phosphate synthase
MKVYVKTPSRLHLGLVDLNGDLGRIFGGLGVGIDYPNVILEAQKSQTFTFSGKKVELTQKLALRFLEAYGIKDKVAIDIKQIIPEHVGLGSGTQLALAIAASLSRLFDVKESINEFAVIMGRTAQSGVGTAVFEHGGLVIDAGKNTQDSSKKTIPLICCQPFPNEWRFIVAIPNVKKGLSNEAEASAFKQLPPMPSSEVGKICRLTMMKLLPAIQEKDITSFGEALTQIQRIVGDSFAKAQGGRYSSSPAGQTIEFMLENGAYGSGQSSWGPTVYGVVKKEQAKELQAKIHAFLDRSVGGNVFVAKGNNRGAFIKVSNNSLTKNL